MWSDYYSPDAGTGMSYGCFYIDTPKVGAASCRDGKWDLILYDVLSFIIFSFFPFQIVPMMMMMIMVATPLRQVTNMDWNDKFRF